MSPATRTRNGARNARKDGHPAPFPLHYVEVGNEDWFDRSNTYDARFTQFYDAIKAKYPQLQIISTVGNEHPESHARPQPHAGFGGRTLLQKSGADGGAVAYV
jgi:hypothetical protein